MSSNNNKTYNNNNFKKYINSNNEPTHKPIIEEFYESKPNSKEIYKPMSKTNTLNNKSEIITYIPGSINLILNSNTKYFSMNKEDVYNLVNRKIGTEFRAIAILSAIKCRNNGKCYYNYNEDEIVGLKFDASEKLFVKRQGKPNFEYVPKAYIKIMNEKNFNERNFKIRSNKKTIEEIEEELIIICSYLKEDIELLISERQLKLKNKSKKKEEELEKYITGARRQVEEYNRLLDYYLSSLL